MLDPRHMEGHRRPQQPLTRLGNLLRIRLTPAPARLTLAEPVSTSESQRQTRGMSTSPSVTLTILQPGWDHIPTSASQDNSSLLNGPWGLLPGIKMDDSLCLGFQNIGGFPESPLHPKNDLIRSFVLKNEFDIFGLAESNVNWSQLNASAQFHKRIIYT
jgi:hypothetical protein